LFSGVCADTTQEVSATVARPIRIALADDHTLFRAGLRKLLACEPDFEVIAEAPGGPELLSLVQAHDPDILLLDLHMRGVEGLDVLRELLNGTHRTRIVVLTASENQEELAQAMKLGVSGIVLKTSGTDLLMQAIRKVCEGEIWLDGRVTANVIKQLSDNRQNESRRAGEPGGLTPREREIAALVGQGYKYREIAEMLSISEQTVKNHLRNMFHKLGISDRLQLALYAIHHNL